MTSPNGARKSWKLQGGTWDAVPIYTVQNARISTFDNGTIAVQGGVTVMGQKAITVDYESAVCLTHGRLQTLTSPLRDQVFETECDDLCDVRLFVALDPPAEIQVDLQA